MDAWFVVKARAVWLFGAVLATAGLAALAYAAALPFAPALDPRGLLPAIGQAGWSPGLVHASIACAVLGMLAGGSGVFLSYTQGTRIRLAKREAEDRQRRVKQYRSDELADGRIEPFFGAEAPRAAKEDRRAA